MGIDSDCAELQKISMFQNVDPKNLKLFAISGQRVRYEAGDAICRQAEPSEAIYVILEGTVDVIRETPHGKVRLDQVTEGNMVGAIGVLCDHPRKVTVEAAGPVTVLQIDRNAFYEIARDVPQLSLAIARELARRLEIMNDKFAAYSEA